MTTTGDAEVKLSEMQECQRCEGSGEIYDAYWTCGDPDCCGSGRGECPDCGGTGKHSPTPPAPGHEREGRDG